MFRFLLLLALLYSTQSASSEALLTAEPELREIEIAEFEFLGCSGDWTDDSGSPEIWRTATAQRVNYLVRLMATCGSDAARDPKAKFDGDLLQLSFEPYSTSGVYSMCPCEYWAKFSFYGEESIPAEASFNAAESRFHGGRKD